MIIQRRQVCQLGVLRRWRIVLRIPDDQLAQKVLDELDDVASLTPFTEYRFKPKENEEI